MKAKSFKGFSVVNVLSLGKSEEIPELVHGWNSTNLVTGTWCVPICIVLHYQIIGHEYSHSRT